MWDPNASVITNDHTNKKSSEEKGLRNMPGPYINELIGQCFNVPFPYEITSLSL